jgi:hypothetical protein
MEIYGWGVAITDGRPVFLTKNSQQNYHCHVESSQIVEGSSENLGAVI